MDNFHAPMIYSWDGQSNRRIRYLISALDDENYNGQELNIDIEYRFLQWEDLILDSTPDSCFDISQWELRITGKPSNDFRGELDRCLVLEEVPLVIRNEVIPIVYDNVAGFEVVNARVIIEDLIDRDMYVDIDDYGDGDEEDEDELDMSMDTNISGDEDEDDDEFEIDEELDTIMDSLIEEDYSKALSSSREVVEALEKVMIRGDEREKSCAICLEEFELGFEATKMPCSHVFHGDCIGSWLVNRCVCPLCRYEVSSYVEERN